MCSPQLIRDAFNDSRFSGRPVFDNQIRRSGNDGIVRGKLKYCKNIMYLQLKSACKITRAMRNAACFTRCRHILDLKNQCTLSLPLTELMLLIDEITGVIFTQEKTWIEQRRFILKNLRDFGFGKKSIEGFIHEEIKELIDSFKKSVGRPITTLNKFNAPVVNVLWRLVTGERHMHDDPKLQKLIQGLTS